MRKRFLLRLIPMLILIGCTAPQKNQDRKQCLDLSLVQQIEFGVSTTEEATQILGSPDQVIKIKRELVGKEAWIYNETSNNKDTQRLGLLVDPKTWNFYLC